MHQKERAQVDLGNFMLAVTTATAAALLIRFFLMIFKFD